MPGWVEIHYFIKKIMQDYPSLKKEDILEAISFAGYLSDKK